MENNPKISVVLPIYNCELYIKDAVYSILNQTVSDFEIIIIDDNSTDNTLKVVQEIKDSRIKIVTKNKNQGLIHSLNLGFEIAKGKYIARIDGDDISEINRFEKQLFVLENNPKIMACGNWLQHFGADNDIVKYKENHSEIVARMLISCSFSMCCCMFHRQVLGAIKFDETKKHVEDYDFWSRVAWLGELYNIQEPLYKYRIHESQVSTVYRQDQVIGDVSIKLFLYKKIGFNTVVYSDELISKFLLLTQNITVDEFKLYLNWHKELLSLNKKTKVFAQNELEKVLKIIRRKLLFTLYFEKTNLGLTKKWRSEALYKLSLQDFLFVVKLKSNEMCKSIFIRWA